LKHPNIQIAGIKPLALGFSADEAAAEDEENEINDNITGDPFLTFL